jgi:hypothetical protein
VILFIGPVRKDTPVIGLEEQIGRFNEVTPQQVLAAAQKYLGANAWSIKGFCAPVPILKEHFPGVPFKSSRYWTLSDIVNEQASPKASVETTSVTEAPVASSTPEKPLNLVG